MVKVAALFPGQGAQTVGMGKEDYDSFSSVRELYARADDLLGYSLSEVCFHGPDERLNTTEVSQPAIFVNSMAAMQVLRERAPEEVASFSGAAGLSLGEYSALVFADALSFEDGLRLVQSRGKAMQVAAEATESGMVSIIGLELDKVRELVEQTQDFGVLTMANYLCPKNYVVSGSKAACEEIRERAIAAEAIKVVPLTVAGAFHTVLMEPAARQLEQILKETEFRVPRIPVISNVDVQAHFEPDEIRSILLRQLCSPVRWEESIRSMITQGYDTFYEIGPGRVLRGLMKRIDRKMKMN